MSEFKVGDKVKVIKGNDTDTLDWLSDMDRFVGGVFEVSAVDSDGDFRLDNNHGYYFAKSWLEHFPAVETILQEASRIVDGPRRADYGHPRDNHLCTARMWSAYLERRFRLEPGALALNQRDVCQLNVLQKVSRDANAPKRDNLVDQCGWSRNAEMVEE